MGLDGETSATEQASNRQAACAKRMRPLPLLGGLGLESRSARSRPEAVREAGSRVLCILRPEGAQCLVTRDRVRPAALNGSE